MKEKVTLTAESNVFSKEFMECMPSYFVIRSYVMIIFIALGLIVLSLIIKYPIISEGTARVTTLVPPESIDLKENGSIEKLLVGNGEIVTSNQTLFILRSDANYEDVHLAKNILESFRFRESEGLSKVQQQEDRENFNILNTLNLGLLKAELNTLERDYFIYSNAQSADIHHMNLSAVGGRQKELKENLDILEKTNTQILKELSLAQQNEKRFEGLFKNGVVSEIDFENARKQTLNLQQKLNNNLVSISNSDGQSSIFRTDKELIGLNHHLEEEKKQNNLRISAQQLHTAIELWEAHYLVKSRSAGKVHFLERLSDNLSIEPGRKVIIVENLNETRQIVAEMTLSPTNYGRVNLGQDVEIVLDSYPEAEFGFLRGKVLEISEVPNNESNYIVIASFAKDLSTTTGKTLPFRDQMVGSSRIITENLSLLRRLFYSFKN